MRTSAGHHGGGAKCYRDCIWLTTRSRMIGSNHLCRLRFFSLPTEKASLLVTPAFMANLKLCYISNGYLNGIILDYV